MSKLQKSITSNSDEEPSLMKGSSQYGFNSMRISKKKILRIDLSNVGTFNDKIKIILIEDFEELFDDFRPENFPNAIALRLEVKNKEESISELLRKELNSKFADRQVLIQINSKFHLNDVNDNFREVELNLNEEEIVKSFDNSKFTTKIFLNIQKNLKIYEADFEKFLKYEKVAHKIFINAINSGENFCLRLLKLFDLNFSQEIKEKIFETVIANKNFETFLAFFDVFDESQVKVEEVQKLFESKNILLKAVESKNEEVVKYLLKLDLKPALLNESIEAALAREYFEIFNEIKEAKSDTCEDECFKMLIERGEEIIKDIAQFHLDIKVQNFTAIEKFVLKYPNYRLCYGTFGRRKVCALYRALKSDELETYCYLRANNFYTDNKEELDEVINKLNPTRIRRMRIENLKYAQDYPDAFIGILISKCKFDAKSPISSKDVQEMLIDLSKNENLKPFLKIASEINLKIMFDFKSESVKNMVPKNTAMGLTYYQLGEIYVGGNREKFELYGTFMHEITHQVLYSIYENFNNLPYCEGDHEREDEWREIFKKEMKKYKDNEANTDIIIQNALKAYNDDHSKRELAVRPNHIMALYLNDPQKVKELQEMHPELFNFILEKVLPDLKIPNVHQLIKLNNDFEVIKRIEESELKLKPTNDVETYQSKDILILASNVPKLALSRLFYDIKNCSKNKLDVKVKNIFIDDKKMKQESLREKLFDLVKNSPEIRIIFDLSDDSNEIEIDRFFKDFPNLSKIIFVCIEETSQGLEFNKTCKNFKYNDLCDESQGKICEKKIKFQRKDFEVSKVCDPIFDEIFSLLCNGKEILVNPVKSENYLENFLPRTIKNASNEELNFDNFLNQIKDEKIVLISNAAGNGKTTLLRKIHESLLEKFPNYWISFVSLIDHTDELLIDDIEDEEDFTFKIFKSQRKKAISFEEKMLKILNLNKVEEKVFRQKFSKGEVKILFDGFDEISPKCKNQTLKLFKKFQTQSQNQIFITTRTHLEQDLKEKLKVESFEIKILTDEDQIKFLMNFWKNSHPDESFIKECAQDLIQKISEIVKDYKNLIGIPLIIQSVAKLYVNDINEHFKKQTKNLKFYEIFKKLIEQSLLVLAERFPSSLIENSLKRSNIFQALEYLTIVNYFDENFATLLGLSIEDFDSIWGLEEVARTGILSYDQNKKIKLNHEIYGQHFLSNIIEDILKTSSSLSDPQIELLLIILTDERFEIARIFLNENLEEITAKNFKLFNDDSFMNLNYKSFVENLAKNMRKETLKKMLLHKNEKSETILHLSVKFGNFETFQNVLEVIKNNLDENVQKELIQVTNQKRQNVLMVATYKNENAFRTLLEFVFKLMEKCEIDQLLNEVDSDNNNVLHLASAYLNSQEIFELFCTKIFEIFNEDKLKNYVRTEGYFQSNILINSIRNENLFCFIFENLFEKFFDFKDFVYKRDRLGQNVLYYLAGLGSLSVLEFAFKKFEEKLLDDELKSFLMTKGEQNRWNLLHCAAGQNLEAAKFLVTKIEKILGTAELKKMMNERNGMDRSPIHNAITNNLDTFSFLFNLTKSFIRSEEEVKELFLKKNSFGKDNLLTIAVLFAPKANLEFLLENISEMLGKEEFKKYLQDFKDEKGRNMLSFSTDSPNLESVKFLWKYFEENFSREEILNFLTEKNCYGENFLYHAVDNFYDFSKYEEFLNFFLLKVYEIFKDKEKFKYYLIVKKNWGGQNILMQPILRGNERAFFFIFENIFEKYLDLKDFIYEVDKNGENFLHLIAQSGSVAMMKFAFKKLQEKLSDDEQRSFLMLKSEKREWNLLHCAAFHNCNLESVKILAIKIAKILGLGELQKMLFEKVQDLVSPLSYTIYKNKFEIFSFLFKMSENFCKSQEDMKNLILTKNLRNECILTFAVNYSPKLTLELLFKKVFEFFEDKERKIFLCTLKGIRGKNLLSLSTENPNLNSIEFLWKVMEENLSKEEISELLCEKDANGNNFLHNAALLTESKENFEFIWLKVFEIFTNDKFENYLKIKGMGGLNALTIPILESKENSFCLIFEKILNIKNFIYECNEEGENFHHMLARFGSFSMLKFALDKMQEKLSEEELKSFLAFKSEKDQNNILHCAALQNKKLDEVKLLVDRIEKILGAAELKRMLNERNRIDRSPLHSAIERNTLEVFSFLFSKSFCEGEDEKFILKKILMEENFLAVAVCVAQKSILEFLFGILEKENIKKCLKGLKSFKGRNLLSLSINNEHLDSIEFLWKILEENLNRDEIIELLNEKDENGNNFLHRASISRISKKVFDLHSLKIFENFKNDEEKLKDVVKSIVKWGYKLLMHSIDKKDEKPFCLILENISGCFIYERDEFGQNFLHQLAQFASMSILEIAFKILQENLSEEELKSFLMTRTKRKHNLLHYAVFPNQTIESNKIWVSNIQKILSNEEFKKMLKQTDADGDFPLHICIQESSSEIFEFYARLYEENFVENEIKQILESRNFMEFAFENKKDQKMREIVKEFYRKLLSCD